MKERTRPQPHKASAPSFTFAPTGTLQLKCASCGQHTVAGGECAACSKEGRLLQRSVANQVGPSGVPPIVHDVVRSRGQPLDAETRTFMEPHFGHDFSQVRVHTDALAAESARAVDALAYTVGRDVVFGAGRWAPATATGRRLLAHELAHVVQQATRRQTLQPKLHIADTKDAGEREADAAAEKIIQSKIFHPRESTGIQVSRQAADIPTSASGTSVRRVDGSSASVSWIDPSSPTGARVPDPAPPPNITESFVTGNSGFRFSNYLHAWCETPDSVHITSSDFHPNSGVYRGPSYAGIPSHVYPTQRSMARMNEGGVEGVAFEQLTGARTISAGVIGGAVGAGVGIAGGAWLGAKGGALIGSLGGPVGAGAGAVIGGIIGGIAGWAAGSATANRVTNFPPIWTRIKLRLFANGQRRCELVEHSHFPSNNFYCDLSQVRNYSALATQQTIWESSGWDSGNPWGISRPTVTP